jgi:hypothetical protein
MKVALLLTGLPRKVQEGYDNCWKHIIENYDTDVYLHFWEDEEYEKVLEVYNPKKYIKQIPFKFTNYKIGIESPNDDMSRPLEQYDVSGNFRGFPMFYSWQVGYNLIDGNYECIIRSRYDLGSPIPFKLENLDLTKLNISNAHWPNSPITDDNLCITSQPVAERLFVNVFDEFIYHSKQTGKIEFQEKNFMEILNRKDLYKYVCKTNELPFQLLRENKLWF